ncbi:hypothetical protein RRG08_011890 [Elysia crispata]|uniref:Uncharacterized protein n=1 Tax=Elysia crispata TaxID=231223 RepID=A0AAE1DIQ0_9GAST|nr:hypothetical protein RRG08_011890 [Elysia crispata]
MLMVQHLFSTDNQNSNRDRHYYSGQLQLAEWSVLQLLSSMHVQFSRSPQSLFSLSSKQLKNLKPLARCFCFLFSGRRSIVNMLTARDGQWAVFSCCSYMYVQ